MAGEEKAVKGAEEAIQNSTSKATAEVTDAVTGLLDGDVSGVMHVAQDYLFPIASALLFLIVGYFVARFISRLASNPVRHRVDETVGRFVGKLVFYSVMIFVLLGVLGRFGISVASFAAVVAAAGFAVGLAFQGTLSNFAAGVLLLVFRPFKVGDLVNAGGVTGLVDEIDLFTTTYNTLDNRRIIIPNSSIANATIENMTYHPERRVDIKVGVDYGADIQRTRETLTAAAESLQQHLIKGPDRGFQIFLSDLGDSSVNWQVRFWAKTTDYWDVWQKLTEAVKVHLDKDGISIPFPQMDVHVDLPQSGELRKVVGQ